MTYLLLCAAFVTVAAAVAVVGARARRDTGPDHLSAMALTAGVLVLLTAIFDNLMIAAGLFDYADAQIAGIRLGRAPIEDFAYPVAGVLLLPAVWHLLDRKDRP